MANDMNLKRKVKQLRNIDIWKTVLTMSAVIFLVSVSANDAVAQARTMTRSVDPVEFNGELLPELLGRPIEKLRVYAFTDGGWRKLVYQIDERYPNNNFYLNSGEQADAHLANKMLNAQDKIFFYVRHTGARAGREMWPEGVGTGEWNNLLGQIISRRGGLQASSISFIIEAFRSKSPRISLFKRSHWDAILLKNWMVLSFRS